MKEQIQLLCIRANQLKQSVNFVTNKNTVTAIVPRYKVNSFSCRHYMYNYQRGRWFMAGSGSNRDV